jgi:hypothetical protein
MHASQANFFFCGKRKLQLASSDLNPLSYLRCAAHHEHHADADLPQDGAGKKNITTVQLIA